MAKFKFNHVKVSGLSTVVPQDEICIYDEAEYYGNSIKKIDRMRSMVGFYKRRVVDETTTPADLAFNAAENLIKEINVDKSSIDALVYVVQQPDYANPATAYFLHQKLGLSKDCIATDINQGCVGWVYGLFMVSQMIESGTFKKVLLLNADAPSAGMDKANRNAAPIFGDGGTATLLEYSKEEISSFYNVDTVSEGFEAIVGPASGARLRLNLDKEEDIKLIMKLREEKIVTSAGHNVSFFSGYLDGLAVFDFTINVVPENIGELLSFANLSREDVPVLCLHQANKQIVQSVAEKADFPLEKAPYQAFEYYGNNTMCSIPTTISLLDKEISKKNICCSGFGNGLVCASCVLDLDKTYISELKDFVKPSYVMTRDAYIEYWINKFKG